MSTRLSQQDSLRALLQRLGTANVRLQSTQTTVPTATHRQLPAGFRPKFLKERYPPGSFVQYLLPKSKHYKS